MTIVVQSCPIDIRRNTQMKLASWTVEFVSHCLANQIGPHGEPDHFQRDSTNAIIFSASWWHSAFTQAIEICRMRGVKGSDILVDLQVEAKTERYGRRYGDDYLRVHEAIAPGTQVRFTAVVQDHITTTMLRALLERMGKSVGISPYGFRLGFGRFNVLAVHVQASDAAEI